MPDNNKGGSFQAGQCEKSVSSGQEARLLAIYIIYMEKMYPIRNLLMTMKANGLPASRMWLRHNEKVGNLVCPRLPHGRHDRIFTAEQIKEIVSAFSPGGAGVWQP